MSDRPTPMTDAAAGYVDENGDLRDDDRRHRWLVLADFARDLERKLAEALEALEDIKGRCSDMSITLHPDADAKGCVDDCWEWSEKALARIDANQQKP